MQAEYDRKYVRMREENERRAAKAQAQMSALAAQQSALEAQASRLSGLAAIGKRNEAIGISYQMMGLTPTAFITEPVMDLGPRPTVDSLLSNPSYCDRVEKEVGSRAGDWQSYEVPKGRQPLTGYLVRLQMPGRTMEGRTDALGKASFFVGDLAPDGRRPYTASAQIAGEVKTVTGQ
jgi:hypothetical protein